MLLTTPRVTFTHTNCDPNRRAVVAELLTELSLQVAAVAAV